MKHFQYFFSNAKKLSQYVSSVWKKWYFILGAV